MPMEPTFTEVWVERGPWTLVWEWIGEGRDGEFDPSDPQDSPRLRATLLYAGEEVPQGSYCTLASVGDAQAKLFALAFELLKSLTDDVESFSKRAMQEWTWRTGVSADPVCEFCRTAIPHEDSPHLHQGQLVCESCWDERLRTTE